MRLNALSLTPNGWADFDEISRTGETAEIESMATDVNERRKDGTTALFRAVLAGDRTLVHQLAEQGADLNAKDMWGRTALIVASINGHIDVVQTLLDYGATINAQNHNGMTPLIEAVLGEREEVVKLLLERGADANIKNRHGASAFDFAAWRSDRIKQLLQKPMGKKR